VRCPIGLVKCQLTLLMNTRNVNLFYFFSNLQIASEAMMLGRCNLVPPPFLSDDTVFPQKFLFIPSFSISFFMLFPICLNLLTSGYKKAREIFALFSGANPL